VSDLVHTPVLVEEVLALLAPAPGQAYIDATIDGGGHAARILAACAPDGRLLGLDRDPELLAVARTRFASELAAGRLVLVQESFAHLEEVAEAHGFSPCAGILFDLGLSSYHLDRSGRGFSFQRDEPLDMRFGGNQGLTAAELLDRLDRAELARIFSQWGEERYAWRIAGRVVESRPIRTTRELYDVVESALPRPVRWQAARSAARIFQALRIAVNDELAAVQAALPQALRCLAAGGRLVVISFHSLEDRIVKHFLREKAQRGEVELLTRKPLCASDAEVERNPRAHSAKLRACRKLRD